MMDSKTLQAQQPTILRIKRKRTDEPLDALVVESKYRRKKSRGPPGFFQFAETVEEETFWEDASLTKDLRTRISTLANGQVVSTEIPEESRESRLPQESPTRRYTIVKKPAERKLYAPPIVHTASKLQDEAKDDFAMYDAVLEGTAKDEEPMDDEMAKFLPMLQEYLRVNDQPSNITDASASSQNNEYVWDVFYHRPVITDWAAAANIATVSGLPATAEDTDSGSDTPPEEDDEDSNDEDFYRNDYPDEDPDFSDEGYIDSEEYLEVEDDEEDERELDDFMASRFRRG